MRRNLPVLANRAKEVCRGVDGVSMLVSDSRVATRDCLWCLAACDCESGVFFGVSGSVRARAVLCSLG